MAGLTAVVFNAVGIVDLADHFPVFLEGDGNELCLAGFGELFFQFGAFPVEGKEPLLDLFLELRFQDMGNAVAGGREGL